MSTPSPDRARSIPAIEASTHVVAVLTGNRASHDLDYVNPHGGLCAVLLSDLKATKLAFERKAQECQEALAAALPFVRGGDVGFNGVGILQMSGVAVDQLAMLFVKQRDYATKALELYYQHQETLAPPEPAPSECAECGHLHFLGPDAGYTACPIEGCDCQGQRTPAEERDDVITAVLDLVEGEWGEGAVSHWVVDADLGDALEIRVIFHDDSVRFYKSSFDGSIVELNSTEGE